MSNINNAAENMELLSKETDVTKAIKEILGLSNQKTDDVQKDYTTPAADMNILDQNATRQLDIDAGNTMVDLVVNQSSFLNEVFVDRISTMRSVVNVYDGNGMLVQAEEGVDPFTTAGNLANFNNIGYDVNLEPMLFLYRINRTQLQAIENSANWMVDINRRMGNVFSNLLLKQALFGTPASGGDTDIEYGYNHTGTALMGRPRIGVRGWLDYLKNGYTYKAPGTGTDTIALPGGFVETWDADKSAFKPINTVLEDLTKAYPAEHDGEDVVFMMSRADFLDFMYYVAGNDASTAKYESGKVYSIAGYKIMILPFLHNYKKTVTVGLTDYYPGMILMGRPKDLIIKINYRYIDYSREYSSKLRTLDSIYNVSLAFPVIVQRFAVAYKNRS
ncbi:MAG: hypothetical protein M0R38_10935 [Bacteroidia bacterium]|nr:hypothetical protein [Bacteroidia bacterium]